MTDLDLPRLRVRYPADLLAAVPYLIGFHPADSVVVVGVRGDQLALAVRGDLPPEPHHVAEIIARQRVDAATVIGYGPAERVRPAVLGVGDALSDRGIEIYDALRVTAGRYWSFTCVNPDCCRPEGTPFDPLSSPVAARFAYAGQEALPSRAALVERVAPVGGAVRAAMRQATARAEARLRDLVPPGPDPELTGRLLAAGAEAISAALSRHGGGGTLADDDVAWLTVLLGCVAVRDLAWQRIDGSRRHVALWTDVVRRAEPRLAAPPASLLAFAAWRLGDGALAVVALERALRADPDYSLALLLDEALRHGISPQELPGRLTPAPGRRWRRRSSSRRAGSPRG